MYYIGNNTTKLFSLKKKQEKNELIQVIQDLQSITVVVSSIGVFALTACVLIPLIT